MTKSIKKKQRKFTKKQRKFIEQHERLHELFTGWLTPCDSLSADELRAGYEAVTKREPWPLVEVTNELHREFLSKQDSDKVQDIKDRLYDLLQDLSYACEGYDAECDGEVRIYEHVIGKVKDLLDICERS